MNRDTLNDAVEAAKRFITLAEKLQIHNVGHTYIPTGALPGAVKRASMDLTRALAEMRKPG